ncbi:hypothetical protein JAAARDRAFT_537812 [Jaapia argillacea MUCL 33604]|uniref:Uncharacterized protein n=1 Tax=Jaapia argillacea MUCL 33604 TaxID=933084 RepID=A0A067PKV7_9AGAM|nr:hypothetical protein JAAARDRAFT_537812 [Jaapia argillacea MUCL 33604]
MSSEEPLLPATTSQSDRLNMAKTWNALTRCKILTVGSFAINFVAQLYGMLTKPNMKDIADANHYAFSPNPYFIAGFFSLQMVLQLTWISKLFIPDDPRKKNDPTSYAEPAQLSYAPIYALGNICIAAWMIFWANERFVWSQIFVTINTLAQLYACFYLLPNFSLDNFWTHMVAQTFAGIGVLDFVDNGAVALRMVSPPARVVQVFSGVFFGLAALTTNPIFSATIVYDVVALYFGQHATWARVLGWMAVGLGAVALVKLAFFRLQASAIAL